MADYGLQTHIKRVQLPAGTEYAIEKGVYKVTTDNTNSTSTAILVGIDEYNEINALWDGMIIAVTMPPSVTSATGVTVKLSGQQAKSVWLPESKKACTDEMKAGCTYLLMYDGTNDRWVLFGNSDTPGFGKITISSTNIIADTPMDTLTLVAGSNVTLTPDATNDKITIASSYTDTKNTAGATDTSSKIFLVGATEQGTSSTPHKVTYTQDTAYVGTDGHLYSHSKQVVNLSDSQALTNKTYNGYTLAAASAKGVDNSVPKDSTSTNLPTTAAVAAAIKTAIDGLPEPMIFKGTVGTGGTIQWSALPAPAATNEGYTYKVITDRTTSQTTTLTQNVEAGDTIISNATNWVVIPSGDEPSGTVTSVGITNGGGLTVSGSPIESSGTITISHADTSSQSSVDNSGNTFIQDITLDTYGHITGIGSGTVSHQTIKQDGITGATAHHFAVCSTAAGTAAKTANVLNGTPTLENGLRVTVFFENANTATSAPTLNINSKGAKNIYYIKPSDGSIAQVTENQKAFLRDLCTFYYVVNSKVNSGKGGWLLSGDAIYSTTSIGSASAGTAIAADDITAWSDGTLSSFGSASISEIKSTGTKGSGKESSDGWSAGTLPSLSYTSRTIPNVTGVGSLPSLTKTDVTNLSSTDTTVSVNDTTLVISYAAGSTTATKITNWSAGTLPTLGTAITADDITSWSAGTLPILNWDSATIKVGATNNYVSAKPSLSYTARSIPNITVSSKTVMTDLTVAKG